MVIKRVMTIGLVIVIVTNLSGLFGLGWYIRLWENEVGQNTIVQFLNIYLSILFCLLLLALTFSTVKVFEQMKKMF